MEPKDLEKYIGLPYDEKEFDCADLVTLVRKELFNHDIPVPLYRPRGAQGSARLKLLSQAFVTARNGKPSDGDLVLMYDGSSSRPNHVGLYFRLKHDDYVLHTTERTGGSILHRVRDLPFYGASIEGFYSWETSLLPSPINGPEVERLIVTPNPVSLAGQTNVPCDLLPGESLYCFLHRHVPNLDEGSWIVCMSGKQVPKDMWPHVYPKHKQLIEIRGDVGKSGLMLVAMLALTYFTFGFGSATAGMWGAGAAASAWGVTGAMAAYAAGAVAITAVLAPKAPSISSNSADSVYSLGSQSNSPRTYQPLPIVFGKAVQVTPDLIAKTSSWYEGNDQYIGLILTPGLNVHKVDTLKIGNNSIEDYDDVTVYYNNFPGMPNEDIPLYSNVDVTDGGQLLDASWGDPVDPQNTPGQWVQRTSSIDTIRLQVDLEIILYDQTSKGGHKDNTEAIQIQYRAVGETSWQQWGTYSITSSKPNTLRRTWSRDVPQGQYEVRMRTAGLNTHGKGSRCQVTWNRLTSIQPDTASYAGIPRIGIKIRATSQLSGNVETITCIAHTTPIPVWNGTGWVTEESDNPGAQILQFTRGIYDENGKLIAGVGMDNDMIDIATLQSFMLFCKQYDFTYNYCVKSARSRLDMLNAFAMCGMGEVTPSNGQMSVVWAGPDQPITGHANMGTIKKSSFQVDYTLAATADGIEYAFYDRETWDTNTLRVVDPTSGREDPINPSQVEGEGVTTKAHAAILARWFLAQNLYQYKSITFDTDLEYLTYRRMGLLTLQHDLTQWGYGGRVMRVVNNGSTFTVTLDDKVPAPANGNAYIGLRIPGEAVYRVFSIAPFSETSDTLTINAQWPSDAAFPGEGTDPNIPNDYIWIYDFKQLPGYKVRVVSLSPSDNLEGATVTVVPESDELWTYVFDGTYKPAPNQSLLQTRPIASNLRISEVQVVQGDTVFTELSANFDITGYADHTVIQSDLDGNSELEEVATTTTRTARWRIPGSGTYTIVVRPYSDSGLPGQAVSGTYTTVGAGAAPVNVDSLTIEELPGGVRRYSWAFNEDTIRSPDFVGVQIRYISGSVASPNWTEMTPIGDVDGYHAAAFESSLPEAGSWTFAVRAMNSSGNLSNTMLTVMQTLSNNLGQELVSVVQQLTASQLAMTQIIEDVDVHSSTLISQALQQYQTNENVLTNRAYISQLQETSVTEEQAHAIVQETIGASVGPLAATVQETSEAIANINGKASAGWSARAQVAANGKYYLAGITVGAYADGETVQTEVGILANNFWVMSSTSDVNYYFPFQIVNGVVYMNDAMIRNASITNAKIGEYIQSNNYQWDTTNGVYSGWRIDKSGTARFAGDVEVRGMVIASAISGQFQKTAIFSWTGSLSADSTGQTDTFSLSLPVRYGESHRPVMIIEATLVNDSGDHTRDGYLDVQRLDGSVWTTIRSKYFAAKSGSADTYMLMVADTSTSSMRQYRLQVRTGTSSWGSWVLTAVNAIVFGLR